MDGFDPTPDLNVIDAEYVRLLGFPRGHTLDGRARELADDARRWYAVHGRPWIAVRVATRLAADGDAVVIDDERFGSTRLARAVTETGADAAVMVAVSAGPEVTDSALAAWRDERPDEYFFFEMYGSAVVEHLITQAGARLCAWADTQAMTVLPHDSPGYTGWDVAEQPRLFASVTRGPEPLPGPIEVLESGMLRPKKSLLAVFALTRHRDRAASAIDLVPCTMCAFGPCQYRRAPYAHAGSSEAGRPAGPTATAPRRVVYVTPIKALRRWAAERLVVRRHDRDAVEASFRYDGTTCSQLGQPLAFDYRVTLGPREAGFPIRAQSCRPAHDDTGHRAMCEYLSQGDALLSAIASETPLIGQPLDHIIGWPRPLMGPGCYCDATARAHKWGLVLETIHYALMQTDGADRP